MTTPPPTDTRTLGQHVLDSVAEPSHDWAPTAALIAAVVAGTVAGVFGGTVSALASGVCATLVTRGAFDIGRGVRRWHAARRHPDMIRPGAARDAVRVAVTPTRYTDHGPVTAMGLAALLLIGFYLLLWALPGLTPGLGYMIGLVVSPLAHSLYLLSRGRI